MIEWPHLVAFNLTLLAAMAAPGPSLLYVSRTAMVYGRRAGIIAGMGLGVMATLWTLAALLGLELLFDLFPWTQLAMKICGGLYLLWIAAQTWRHANAPVVAAPQINQRRLFVNGMLVNLANPKSVLFAAAVIVAIFPTGLTITDKALIFTNHLIVELLVQSGLALLLSTTVIRSRYLAAKPRFDRIAGTLMGALGLRLLLDPPAS